jgi:hypothetical protein
LITISIRVNVPPTAGLRGVVNRGRIMKKQLSAKWSFWNWLMGSGESGTGTSG